MEQFRRVYDDRPEPMLSHGQRFDDALATFVRSAGYKKVFIISSRSLAQNTDCIVRLENVLGVDTVAGSYVGIGSHTPVSHCLKLFDQVRSCGDVDCLVTLGGGSSTDAAKLVRFALANDAFTKDDLDTLWGGRTHHNPKKRANIKPPTLPLVHIPTTLSGGEFQHLAAATDEALCAKRLYEPGVDPTLVIQDPELCLLTPSRLWLASGFRAVDHCVETLCSLQSNARGDEEARKGLAMLAEGLSAASSSDECKSLNPQELESRLKNIRLCQKGVISAMAAVSSGVPLGASHAIGHQLGSLGVGHGETSCIMLPAVCRFNARHNANVARQEQCRDLLLRTRSLADIISGVLHTPDQPRPDLANVLALWISKMGLPRSLDEVGIVNDHDLLVRLARNSLEDIWIQTNPVKLTRESQVIEILKMVETKDKLSWSIGPTT